MKMSSPSLSPSPARSSESGNVLIYVLIAIALFAALTFTLSGQEDTGEAGSLSDDKVEIQATQLISTASQIKSVIDQMLFSGAQIEDLDFTLPTDTADFNDANPANNIYKVYHPEGGGLNMPVLGGVAVDDDNISIPSDPKPGWYLGRFNNVSWTPKDSSSGPGNYEDVILTAYGIDKRICENINEKVTGSTDIPEPSAAIKTFLVDKSISLNGSPYNQYNTGSQADFTTDGGSPVCTACHETPSLCVGKNGIYAFYTVIADL